MAYYSDTYYTPTTTDDGSGQSTAKSTAVENVATTFSTSTIPTTTLISESAPSSFAISDISSSTLSSASTAPSSTTTEPTSPLSSLNKSSTASGLSTGAKAGIGGGIVVLLIFALLAIFLLRQRRRTKNVGLLRGKSVLASPMSRKPPSVDYRNTNPEPFRVLGVRGTAGTARAAGEGENTAYHAGPMAPSSTMTAAHLSPYPSRSVSPSPSARAQQTPYSALSAQHTPATAYPGGGYGALEHQAYAQAQEFSRGDTPPPPFQGSWVERR